ncbi:hypothetical protein Z043_122361 [Scleropages formosus]|uniref:Uncharacterized protein n=1 Tax=Scleropages formosus TaxID=113540 RepID=A0A0P7W9Q8_SCLFO|nr:hypothetical protein Z043_122361 [Scleropages formosus]
MFCDACVQMAALQRGSGEVLKQSLGERDLKIASLRAQLEKLKRDSGASAGTVQPVAVGSRPRPSAACRWNSAPCVSLCRRPGDQLAEGPVHAGEEGSRSGRRGGEVAAGHAAQGCAAGKHDQQGVPVVSPPSPGSTTHTALSRRAIDVQNRSRRCTLLWRREVKESAKVQEELRAREKDVEVLQKRLEELQQTRIQMQTALVQRATERDALKVALDVERKEKASLGAELDETRRKEQEAITQLKQSQEWVERLSSQIIQAVSRTPGGSPFQGTLSDQQMVQQMTEIIREGEALRNKVKELQEELEEAAAQRDSRIAEEHTLKNLMEEGNVCYTWRSARLREALSVPALHREVTALKALRVPAALAWVHATTVGMLDCQLTQVEEATRALLHAGIDVSNSEEYPAGISGGIQALCERQQQCEDDLRALQEELQASQKTQIQSKEKHAKELQEHLESIKEEHAKELQERLESLKEDHSKELQERLESLKKDHAKELQEHLESLKEDHAKELQERLESLKEDHAKELQEHLESLKEDHAKELQEHLASLKEELEKQEQQKLEAQKEEEVRLKLQLEEMREKLESAQTAEATLREQVRTQEAEQEARLAEAEQKGAESERKCWMSLEEEYREQVRQHAHTIVAMEEKIVELRQSLGDNDKERDGLREQLRDVEEKLKQGEAEKATEVQALEQKITALRDALAEARKEADDRGEVIAALSRDLSTANARLSDNAEVSEQQKTELEQQRALVVQQKVHLGTLTQKLGQMSRLVDQKGAELQRAREELRLCREAQQDRVGRERQEGLDPKRTCAECQATAQSVTSST